MKYLPFLFFGSLVIGTIAIVILFFSSISPPELLEYTGEKPAWADDYCARLDENGGVICLKDGNDVRVLQDASVSCDDVCFTIVSDKMTHTVPYSVISTVYIY